MYHTKGTKISEPLLLRLLLASLMLDVAVISRTVVKSYMCVTEHF